MRYAGLLLLAGAIAWELSTAGKPGGGIAVRVLPAVPATVTSVGLPPAGQFSSLTVSGGRLILSGGPEGSVPVSGYQSTLRHGRAAGKCHAAVVDPRTLSLEPIRTANCGDPSLYGEHVLPIAYLVRRAGANGSGVGEIAVRIARSDRAARDGYTMGPVVTTYPQCSDCQIAWVYGDGSLWLYNPLAHPARERAVLLRVSERTGAAVERWALPEIVRALLAVDRDGLWLSPSLESGTPGSLPPTQRVPYQSLYRISPDDSRVHRVLREAGGDARWLVASGNTVSAAIDGGRGRSTIWTFTGLRTRVHGPALDASAVEAEFGTGDPTVAGNTAIGFYSVVVGNQTETVMQVEPGSRREQAVAKIRSRSASADDPPPSGVALDGAFFYLDPPTNYSVGSAELHRVIPR